MSTHTLYTYLSSGIVRSEFATSTASYASYLSRCSWPAPEVGKLNHNHAHVHANMLSRAPLAALVCGPLLINQHLHQAAMLCVQLKPNGPKGELFKVA